MADDFHTRICSGGSWWDPARTTASFDSMPSSISCSTAICDIGGTGNFSWTAAELMESKAGRSCDESAGSAASGSSVTFQDSSNLKAQTSDVSPQLIDSTMQLSSFGMISSPSLDWTHPNLLRTNGGNSFHALLREDLSLKNYARHDQRLHMGLDNSPCSSMLNMNQSFELGQQHHLISAGGNESSDLGISSLFPLSPSSYGCSPSILQSLMEVPVPENKVLQQSIYDDRAMSYRIPGAVKAFRGSSNHDLMQPSWAKFTQILKSSAQKQQPSNQLQFSNNAPFWNASAAASVSEIQSGFYAADQPWQFVGQPFEPKLPALNRSNLSDKGNQEGVRDPCSSSSTKKSNTGPALKKPRIETVPSPLPTFKVRKEKLGDRITALQQLVSPFGKTDRASVLHEAIEYIKFLHDQVSVLSTPYLKNGHPIQHQQSTSDKPKDGEGTKKDLRSRGLCLVPIASTYPVASETAADFWHPTFGATFR